jgi:hypothetical protein
MLNGANRLKRSAVVVDTLTGARKTSEKETIQGKCIGRCYSRLSDLFLQL